jgi:hypothetical protein
LCRTRAAGCARSTGHPPSSPAIRTAGMRGRERDGRSWTPASRRRAARGTTGSADWLRLPFRRGRRLRGRRSFPPASTRPGRAPGRPCCGACASSAAPRGACPRPAIRLHLSQTSLPTGANRCIIRRFSLSWHTWPLNKDRGETTDYAVSSCLLCSALTELPCGHGRASRRWYRRTCRALCAHWCDRRAGLHRHLTSAVGRSSSPRFGVNGQARRLAGTVAVQGS